MQTENFRGVYSSKETDHTAQAPGGRERKRYWLVWTIDDTAVRVQPLNASLEPSGERRLVDMDTFISRFRHEPDVVSRSDSSGALDDESHAGWHRLSEGGASLTEPITGDDEIDDLIGITPDKSRPDKSRSDKFRPYETQRDTVSGVGSQVKQGSKGSGQNERKGSGFTMSGSNSQSHHPSAGKVDELESGSLRNVRRQAIDLDDVDFLSDAMEAERVEQELRADFGLAVTYLRRGERKKAIDMFDTLAESSEGVVPEHKHVFTDFGISLRKTKLPKQALKHHLKAAELSPADDHAYHNIARIYYELGDVDSAVRYLKKSLDLNPALTASLRFLAFIRRNHDVKKLKVDL